MPMPAQWYFGFFMFFQWPPLADFSDWKTRCEARTAAFAVEYPSRQPTFSPQF